MWYLTLPENAVPNELTPETMRQVVATAGLALLLEGFAQRNPVQLVSLSRFHLSASLPRYPTLRWHHPFRIRNVARPEKAYAKTHSPRPHRHLIARRPLFRIRVVRSILEELRKVEQRRYSRPC